MNPEHKSEFVLRRSDEQNARSGTFNVESTIEVHLSMLGVIGRDRLLDLRPFGDEVSQNL